MTVNRFANEYCDGEGINKTEICIMSLFAVVWDFSFITYCRGCLGLQNTI